MANNNTTTNQRKDQQKQSVVMAAIATASAAVKMKTVTATQTAPVMDSDGQCDSDGNAAGNVWHNDNTMATRRQLTAQQHLQYME